jgi:anti-anti-sigma factor
VSDGEQQLAVQVVRGRHQCVLLLAGEIGVDTAAHLRHYAATELRGMARGGMRLVLDLAQVTRIDAAGVIALLRVREEAQRLGSLLRLRGLRPQLDAELRPTLLADLLEPEDADTSRG